MYVSQCIYWIEEQDWFLEIKRVETSVVPYKEYVNDNETTKNAATDRTSESWIVLSIIDCEDCHGH